MAQSWVSLVWICLHLNTCILVQQKVFHTFVYSMSITTVWRSYLHQWYSMYVIPDVCVCVSAIRHWKWSFISLQALQQLSISNNHMSSVPAELCQLHVLQELYLANNQLRQWADTTCMQYMQYNVHMFYMSMYNSMSCLPVHWVILAVTYTCSLPDSIGALKKLKKLYVQKNKLLALPQAS